MKKSKRERYEIVWTGKVWDKKFTKKVIKNYNISFCVTCMDRLYDLEKTLPFNLENNKEYSNLEFVILDYNSKDGLEEWMKKNMMEYIESGKVSYYRTIEPTYFSMSHSRNIAFKVATGEIVNNLDADNYTISNKYKVKECWASFLNRIANECSEKVVFAKGKQLLRGRVGFYKKEFIELGGYDENLEGYGYDDRDLVTRAQHLGFVLYTFGGQYVERIKTSRKEKGKNMKRSWRETEMENKIKSLRNIIEKKYIANLGKHWGKAHLIKNFKEEIDI